MKRHEKSMTHPQLMSRVPTIFFQKTWFDDGSLKNHLPCMQDKMNQGHVTRSLVLCLIFVLNRVRI